MYYLTNVSYIKPKNNLKKIRRSISSTNRIVHLNGPMRGHYMAGKLTLLSTSLTWRNLHQNLNAKWTRYLKFFGQNMMKMKICGRKQTNLNIKIMMLIDQAGLPRQKVVTLLILIWGRLSINKTRLKCGN